MYTKKELFERIDNEAQTHYPKKQVKDIVNSISTHLTPPLYFKKGDVITCIAGTKRRPHVVIKVDKDILYALPLSTTKDCMNLCKSKSRFFGSHYFSKGLASIKKSVALENYTGIYDNPKVLNKAIKLLKEEINRI